MGMRLGIVRPRMEIDVVRFEADFAIAAIAARGALFAEMVRARIFCAFDADARRLFFADAANE
jgi:hypothetical protein